MPPVPGREKGPLPVHLQKGDGVKSHGVKSRKVASDKGLAASGWQKSRGASAWQRRGNNVVLSKITPSPLPVGSGGGNR